MSCSLFLWWKALSVSLFCCLVASTSNKAKGGVQKWTMVASMSALSPNKAWQKRLKVATLGKEYTSLHIWFWLGLSYFWIILQQSGLFQRERKEASEREGKGRCAWIINNTELYMGDKNSGWITGTVEASDAQMAKVLDTPLRWSQSVIRLNLHKAASALTNDLVTVRKSGTESWWREIQLSGIEATSH